MTRFLDVGICQMEVVDNKVVNLSTAKMMISEAEAADCKLDVLPEMFNCPYAGHYFPVYAEPIPGITSTRLSELAREIGIYLIAGSMPERDGEQIFNTSMVFNLRGK